MKSKFETRMRNGGANNMMTLLTRAQFETIKRLITKRIQTQSDKNNINPYSDAYDILIEFFNNIIIYYYGNTDILSPRKTGKSSKSQNNTEDKYDLLQTKLKALINISKTIQKNTTREKKLEDCFESSFKKLCQQHRIDTSTHEEEEDGEEPVELESMSRELSEIFQYGLYEKISTPQKLILESDDDDENDGSTKEKKPVKPTSNKTPLQNSSRSKKRRSAPSSPSRKSTAKPSPNSTPGIETIKKKTKKAVRENNLYEAIKNIIELIKKNTTKQDTESQDSLRAKKAFNQTLLLISKKKHSEQSDSENKEIIESVNNLFISHIKKEYSKIKNINLVPHNLSLIDIINNDNDDTIRELQQQIIDYYTPGKINPAFGLLNPLFYLKAPKNDKDQTQIAVRDKYKNIIFTAIKNIGGDLRKNLVLYVTERESVWDTIKEFFKSLYKKRTANDPESQTSRINDTENHLKHIVPIIENLNDKSNLEDILKALTNFNRAIFHESRSTGRNENLKNEYITARKIIVIDSRLKETILSNIKSINTLLDNHSETIGCLLTPLKQKENLYFEMNLYLNQQSKDRLIDTYYTKVESKFGRLSAFLNGQHKGKTARKEKIENLANELILCNSKKDYLNLIYHLSELFNQYINHSNDNDNDNDKAHYHDDVLIMALLTMLFEVLHNHVLIPIEKNLIQLDFTLSELETLQQLLSMMTCEMSDKIDSLSVRARLEKLIESKKSSAENIHEVSIHSPTKTPPPKATTTPSTSSNVEKFKIALKTKMKHERFAMAMKSTGYFTLNATELGYLFQGIGLLAEHIPLVSTISAGIGPAGKFIDATQQETNAKDFVQLMNSYGGDYLFKIATNNAIDKLADIFKNEIAQMAGDKNQHVTRFAEFCFNRMKNAFSIDHPTIKKLSLEERLIASVFLRNEKLQIILPGRYRKVGDTETFTDTKFEELIETMRFKFFSPESESIDTENFNNSNSSSTITKKLFISPKKKQKKETDDEDQIETSEKEEPNNSTTTTSNTIVVSTTQKFRLFAVNSVSKSTADKYETAEITQDNEPPVSEEFVKIIGRTLQAQP